VKLSRIELPGFGCLSSFDCELAPGLNLFFGDNEAGKSTLQQAICAMLYGFFEGERALKDESARYERFRPWAGGVYRGALAYELEDGRRFEVRRDFSTTDIVTRVHDAVLGTDVTPQFPRARHGNVAFARKHLGMSRAVFQSCAFISQGEIFDVAKASPSQIGDAIAALADSARRDVSAAKAIERLETAAAKVGSDRARTAELPKARESLNRVTAELRAADEARRAVAEKSRRLEDLLKQSRTMAEQMLRGEYLQHRVEAMRLRDQLRQLDEAETLAREAMRKRDELREFATISALTRDEVIALRAQRERASQGLARLREQRDSAPTVADDERLAYEVLRSSVGGFTEEQVRSLEVVAYRVDAPLKSRSPILAILVAMVRAIVSVARNVVRFVLRRKPGQPAAGSFLRQDDKPLDSEPILSQGEAFAVLEKYWRFLSLRPRVEESARIEAQVEGEEKALASIETRLRAIVAEANVGWAKRLNAHGNGSTPERQAASERADYAGGRLAPTASGMVPLDDAIAAFEDAWRKREEYVRAENEAGEAERRRGLLLNGRSREEMASALAEHEETMRQTLAEYPRLEGAATNHSPEQLARAVAKLQDDSHRVALEQARLDQDVMQALERFRPRAEIEEDVAHWEREVARLEKARAALGMATETIEQAMHDVYRDFAPAVNAFLSEGLEAATDGRYQRAHVDPSTLRVSLLVPETGQVITDPPVSHGTRTLLYVLMRIGLAQHMSAIGEPVPLVLDDPFVDLDSRRLRRIMEFLLDLSPRMQILLFTKDRETLEWFRERAVGLNHRIHSLSGSLVAGTL
jgi:DNA repair exonuclease SbcCD ATPase subunit